MRLRSQRELIADMPREPAGVPFADDVRPADSAAPAAWIAGACRGAWGTVGALVPHEHAVVLRVHPPDPGIADWWSAYRDVYEVVASVGAQHTSRPKRAWFALWEGHGFTDGAHVGAPTFDLPHRRYFLLTGPVRAVTGFRVPGSSTWHNPDLFWPDDRQWFVATDVDLWSLYIGGTTRFVDALASSVPTPTEVVALDRPLEVED